MTLYEFNLLDDESQYNVIWDKGKFIQNAFEEGYSINLYAIDMFFVEVYYNAETNKIVNKKSFLHGHLLDKYSNLNNFI